MKKHTFTVTLTFSGKITSDEDIKELADNIARGLQDVANHQGLAPESSEEFTKIIEVVPVNFPEAKVTINLLN